MLSGRTIRPSFSNVILSFLMPLGFFKDSAQWVTPLSFAITLMPSASPKYRIQDPSQQLSRDSFLLNLSFIVSNGECPRITLIQPASPIEESNKHQRAVLRYVQRAVHLGLITEVFKAQCYEKESRPPHKHYSRLVLFYVPSSLVKLCRAIRLPYGFRCGKSETQ